MSAWTDSQLILELERRMTEERLRFYAPTPKQIEFHLSPKRSKWALGGNRTGKTVGLAVLCTLYALGKDALPYMDDWPSLILDHYARLAKSASTPALRQWYGEHATPAAVDKIVLGYRDLVTNIPSPARIWVVSETFEVQRDVVQREIVGDPQTFKGGWLPTGEVKSKAYRNSNVLDTLTLRNGHTIGWKSYDQGREKFQGASMHLIAFDEEPPKDIYDECSMRVMDVRGVIAAAMTPLKGLTFVADMVVGNDKKPADKRDDEVMHVNLTWDDNPYLSEDEKRRLESTMDESDREARQYGRFLVPGRPVFNVKSLRQYLDECSPGDKGNLIDGKFERDDNGYIEVWEPPVDGAEYVIGGDVAEGLAHGDYSVGYVLRRDTFEHVALWHGHMDADEYGRQMRALAEWYNEATLAPEANNHGLTAITAVKEYANLYRMTQFGKSSDKEQPRYGWLTSSATKPLMIGYLQAAIRDRTLKTRCKRFIEECLWYVRNDKGGTGAISGKWDDVVMAAAIAVTVHSSSDMDLPPPRVPGKVTSPKREFGEPGWVHPSIAKERRDKEWEDEPWQS